MKSWKPGSIYNALIAPISNFSIKGAIWYQGESNSDSFKEAGMYGALLKNLIYDWREAFHKQFPFIIVQLPNFGSPILQPGDSKWAIIREAQSNALKIGFVGMTVNYDVGEATDIHPRDKASIGLRLGKIASNVAYKDKNTDLFPLMESFIIEGNRVKIKFKNVGKGLIAKDKYGYLKGFSMMDSTGKSYWAKARIHLSNTIVVTCDDVEKPYAVRYAWADNPEDANLISSAGLPASPFRTDGREK